MRGSGLEEEGTQLLASRSEGGEASEADISTCTTGDAVLPVGVSDCLKAKFVRKHDDNTVTYHESRHAAYRGESPVDGVRPGKLLSQLDVADAWRHFIYGRQVAPRSMTDIRGTVSTVVWHTMAGLLFGMIPALGVLPLLFLTFTYAIQNFHLFGGPAGEDRKTRIRQRILYGLGLYIMLYQCMIPLIQYTNLKAFYLELKATDAAHRAEQLGSTIMFLQLDAVRLLCSISSLFLIRVLAINTMRVYSDIAYYKALAEEHLPKRSRNILNEFKHRFTEIYEPFSAPVRIYDEYFNEKIGWVRKSLAIFSAASMFLSLTMWYNNVVHRYSSRASPVVTISYMFSAIIIGQNWYMLMIRLFGVVVKLKRNAKQLLLFRTLNADQDFTSWDTASKGMLREMLQARLQRVCQVGSRPAEMREVLLEHKPNSRIAALTRSFKASIFSSDFKDFESWMMRTSVASDTDIVTAIPDRFISHLVSKLVYSAKADEQEIEQLSLHKAEDAACWWNLRQFLLLDFADESCSVDYSITVTLLLLGCFSCIGFIDWTANKEVIASQSGKIMGVMGHHPRFLQLVALLGPIAGMVLAATTITTLSILFYELAQTCVDINRLLDDDAKMLRDAMVELQVQSSVGSSQGAASADDAKALVPLLSSMLQSMQDTDQKQKLFGFVVDGRLQNGLIFSVTSVILSLVWKQFGAVAMDVDMEQISNMTSVLFD